MCEARDFGDEHKLHCLDETAQPCLFCEVHSFGVEFRFCECPLRVYLAKHLKM